MNTFAKLGAAALLAACGAAQAATISAPMTVSATVGTPAGACTTLQTSPH